MIIYFSATGNSKHVAERIQHPGETLIFIPDAIEQNHFDYTVSEDRVGFIFPTYNWALPSIVTDFLSNLTLRYQNKPYLFYVGTFGTTTGAAAALANSILKEKGYALDSFFDIRMPDTWTPIFDLSDPEKVRNINENAEKEINDLILQLDMKQNGKHMDLTTPLWTGRIGEHLYNTNTRKTSHLKVGDNCIGCGLCARKCPVHAIEMKEKKPEWVKEKCVMCLGCLHRCPKFAISCGSATAKHGQYTNPYTKI